MKSLNAYEKIIGKKQIELIKESAEKIAGKHILNISSTHQGGGVAEILNRFVPLMNSLGIDVGWRILHGTPDFFIITKKFSNALMGERIHFTKNKQRLYLENCERFSSFTHIHHDAVIIHDIQPLPLINFYKKRQPWIWRCHTDISTPTRNVYNYLKGYIQKYDKIVLLSKKFLKKDLKPEQSVMAPSIDPLSMKNKELSEEFIDHYLNKFGIPTDKPIICQVSRFDKWKDHLGVVNIFKEVRKKVDCRLVLIGSMALDDPMGQKMYEELVTYVKSWNSDIIVLNVANDLLVNALQRKAVVVIQKSIKEGFGLTVSEALWKGTPVVASNVGGISDQVVHGKSGYLLNPYDLNGFAEKVTNLIKKEKLRKKMGIYGKEYVKEHFLITTHMLNWINQLDEVFKKEKAK
ncbi:MAG: glycosyltransferase [Nanoarchaeota archaeon]|nr:glycosyltransferase [Nanoarchaeota archaeon]